ncbi:16S rRNA (cytosine(967)-C(5))-methyltransferase RsmB [Bacillota bacterium LX-D]|nr:16S rRNA (cytosine(967)-C(5))-methyltransferase RsmB [Bacillota bacterium LX-D]
MISAREVALKVLYQIEVEDAYANLALSHYLGQLKLSTLERGLATELVYGVTRSRNTLDWILSQFITSGLKKLTPWIRNILRLGVYQLFYLKKIPESAAVNESVNLAKKYGHAGTVKLVNGVLRNLIRKKANIEFPSLADDPVGHISLKYSHPAWLIEKWLKEFGEKETMELCQANNQPSANSIRTNTLKTTPESLKEQLELQDIKVDQSRFVPEGLLISNFSNLENLEGFKNGLFLMQDESSMLVSYLLQPKPGSFLIDSCAAPGTKTTHLAQMAKDDCQIIACDVHEHKLELIAQNCQRLGLKSIKPNLLDARKIGQVYQGQADYILVDAPCSGLGVLRRRPDARWKKNPKQIKELSILQLEILKGVCGALKQGGVLVYSTCSISPEENIEVIKKFLHLHQEFKLDSIRNLLPFELTRDEDISLAEKGCMQFLPHVHGTDGFFMARMVRN